MKAIVLEKPGGVENLRLTESGKPAPKENEVLVAVKAISINPVDVKVKYAEEGLQKIVGQGCPVILGWDISGIVVSLGDKVTKFKKGDAVFGMVNFPGHGKAYAEFVAAPENQLAMKPENISFEEAAAATLAALTALQVLESRVKKGDRVLIHAGSGGVGHFAIQIAKALGAYVITTCSAKNRDFVMSLGADEHIDYRSQTFEEVVSKIDFVLDGMGGDVLLNSVKVLKKGGSVISLPHGNFSEEVLKEAETHDINVGFLLVQSNGKDMNKLREMLESGKLKSEIYKTFAFADMADAHTEVKSGRTVGKVIVIL